MRIKIQQMNIDILKPSFTAKRLFLSVSLNRDCDVERFKSQRHYLPKGIIKNYIVIMKGKNFYDQSIDSELKSYEQGRKLATGES